MRIGIDARSLKKQRAGIGNYIHGLVRLLPQVGPEHDYFFYSNREIDLGVSGKRVSEQIDRLRALSYDDLLEQLDEPEHYTIRSRTGRELMGETQVFWDSREDGDLRVLVDVCEPKPGVVSSIVSDDFIRAPDGSFVGE